MITNHLWSSIQVHHSRRLFKGSGDRTCRRSLSCKNLISPNAHFCGCSSQLNIAATVTQSDAPRRSGECSATRRGKLTSSRFSKALGFWKSSRAELWHEKVLAHYSGRSSELTVSSKLTQSDAAQRSEEWFALRRDKLTTSTFSTALGFWKGNRRVELWEEKVFSQELPSPNSAQTSAMEWGVEKEAYAIEKYKSITGNEVNSMGFVVHSEQHLGWLGASPDGLLDCPPMAGILEVKCPFNKGKPETALPWSTMPFYYMPQIQGQLEIMDREWADLYCWTPNGSTIFRVHRDRHYWHLIHGILREFWWENVVPAREAMLLGMIDQARTYQPTTKHRQTGLVVSLSIKLASDSKLTCHEIAGHVEFFR